MVSIGTDTQCELLHDTEKEYLELAEIAQNHVNKLNQKISTLESSIVYLQTENNNLLQELETCLDSNLKSLEKNKYCFQVITNLIKKNRNLRSKVSGYKDDFHEAIARPNKRSRIV